MNQPLRFLPQFLSVDDVLAFHKAEIEHAGGTPEVRDIDALEAAVSAPMASFDGEYLLDIFEMAATYINSICIRHPFLDGNKRAGAASALVFLHLNGYELHETHDEELADQVLALLTHDIDKDDLANYFRKHCKLI
ncbi:MAG: type II toxin-antitoxin system death-on-curing family toxin [Chloroflexota bacterium]